MLADHETVVLLTGRRRRSAAKVSLTPLVDCVFILLIFFMLQSNLLTPRSMPLQRPQADSAADARASTERPRVLQVELHADGSVWVDGARYETASLGGALAALDPARYESALVAADKGVPLQRAVDVIDQLSARGHANVLLREARQFR